MKKLSFIVPIYNTQDYVVRCLTSLVNQNIPAAEYDIIIVDDGSADNSLELVETFAKSYTNIRVFSQENKGPAEARNKGFELSNSKYVWFIDSDDWITENCMKELLRVAEDGNLDMFGIAPNITAQSDFQKVFKGPSSISSVLPGKERLLSGDNVVGIWCYIYSSEFLRVNELSFMKGVYSSEDEEFTPKALFFAKRVAFVKDFSVYFYFIRENSVCRAFSKRSLFDKLYVANSLNDFAKNNPMEDCLKNVFNYRASFVVLSGINCLIAANAEYELFLEYIAKAKQLHVYPLKAKPIEMKTRVLFWLWNAFPYTTYKMKKNKK
jgi:glycosyltransferase involved in cell wall biosynthesis